MENRYNLILVTPIYKLKPSPLEARRLKISLFHNSGIEHCFIKPSSLDGSFYKTLFPSSSFLSFADKYFDGIRGYNDLMTSSELYKSFKGYEYILVLQLDALLFQDCLPLLALCYDYIGSSWPEPVSVPLSSFYSSSESVFNYLVNRLEYSQQVSVGNGGLSLRRVDTFLWLTENIDLHNLNHEDLLFSILLTKIGARIPCRDKANRLFVEKLAANMLPPEIVKLYGAHGIDKVSRDLEHSILSLCEHA